MFVTDKGEIRFVHEVKKYKFSFRNSVAFSYFFYSDGCIDHSIFSALVVRSFFSHMEILPSLYRVVT